jgi:colicin import membrane protein
MKPSAFPLSFLAALMFCAIPATGSAAEPVQTLKVDSLDMADQILEEAKESRNQIERKFLAEKLACADKFFASACEDEARERRRSALVPVRGREVEANAFKRRLRTAERDDALVEKNLSPGTVGKPRKESVPKEERRPARDTTDSTDTSGGDSTAGAGDQARLTQVGYSDREQRHEEKLKRLQAEEDADARRRAARVLAYEKKARESEARQKEIALHKAEKSRRSEKKSSQAASSQSTSSEAANKQSSGN